MEDRIKALVNEQYEKMNLADSKISWDLKQVYLGNKCQKIAYNDWGISSNILWCMIDKYVEELIPSEYEEDKE